jgi:hypothetical protein
MLPTPRHRDYVVNVVGGVGFLLAFYRLGIDCERVFDLETTRDYAAPSSSDRIAFPTVSTLAFRVPELPVTYLCNALLAVVAVSS